MRILVSACLLGIPCRYDGREAKNEDVTRLGEKHTLIPFCPEIYGGLPTPREPAERNGARVTTQSGVDVTAEYERGACAALAAAQICGCRAAILQDRSPSCGAGVIHDGGFEGGLMPGDGVTAALLKANGIEVIPASEASARFA